MVLGGVAGICSSEFSEKSMGLDARGRLFSGLGGLLTLGGDSGIAGTLEGVVGKGGASGSSSATRSLSSAANISLIPCCFGLCAGGRIGDFEEVAGLGVLVLGGECFFTIGGEGFLDVGGEGFLATGGEGSSVFDFLCGGITGSSEEAKNVKHTRGVCVEERD